MFSSPSTSARVLLSAAVLAILLTTLLPGSVDPRPWSECTFCGATATADAILNVALFVPLGLALGLLGSSWKRAVLVGAALSVSIELAQLLIPGRDATVVDIASNVTGAAAGMLVLRSSSRWLAPVGRRRTVFSLGAAAAAVAVFGLTGYLLQPSLPRSGYYARWTADIPGLELYRGRVLDAELGGTDLPPGRLEDPDRVRTLLLNGAPLQVRAVAAPPTTGLAPIVTIAIDGGQRVALLGVDRKDLLFMFRRRAALLKLSEPHVRLADALDRVTAGDTITITVSRNPASHCLGLDGDISCGLGPPSLGAGWMLLHSGRFPGWFRACLGLAWMTLAVMPFGFWARPDPLGASGVLAIVVAVWLTPGFYDLAQSGPVEYLGVGLGVLAGQLIHRRSRRCT